MGEHVIVDLVLGPLNMASPPADPARASCTTGTTAPSTLRWPSVHDSERRDPRLHGLGRRCLRQRRGRKLLGDASDGAPRSGAVAHSSCPSLRDLRGHRRFSNRVRLHFALDSLSPTRQRGCGMPRRRPPCPPNPHLDLPELQCVHKTGATPPPTCLYLSVPCLPWRLEAIWNVRLLPDGSGPPRASTTHIATDPLLDGHKHRTGVSVHAHLLLFHNLVLRTSELVEFCSFGCGRVSVKQLVPRCR